MGCIQDKTKSSIRIIQSTTVKPKPAVPAAFNGDDDNLDDETTLKMLILQQTLQSYKKQNHKKSRSIGGTSGSNGVQGGTASLNGSYSLNSQITGIETTKNNNYDSKSLINPNNNETVQRALLKIKHKKNTAKSSSVKRRTKKVLEVLEIDHNGQIKIDKDNNLIAALQAGSGNKSQRAIRAKFLKQLESAHFTINQNKLQVVVEEYTEEDEHSDKEWPASSDKFENSTIYSSNTSSKSIINDQATQQMLREVLIRQFEGQNNNASQTPVYKSNSASNENGSFINIVNNHHFNIKMMPSAGNSKNSSQTNLPQEISNSSSQEFIKQSPRISQKRSSNLDATTSDKHVIRKLESICTDLSR
eukprot:403358840